MTTEAQQQASAYAGVILFNSFGFSMAILTVNINGTNTPVNADASTPIFGRCGTLSA
jgi:hypothetical protein